MPVPKVEPVLPILEETPPPESGLLGAMLIVMPVKFSRSVPRGRTRRCEG